MFDKEAWERFIGLMDMEFSTGDVEKRAAARKQLFSASVGGNTKKRFVHSLISPHKRTTTKRWELFVFAVYVVLISSLSTLGFIFIFSLFLVVQFKWAKFPRTVKYWNKMFCFGYCYGFIIWKIYFGDCFLFILTVFFLKHIHSYSLMLVFSHILGYVVDLVRIEDWDRLDWSLLWCSLGMASVPGSLEGE